MITIGLSGGIGSGKSTISLLLSIYGIPVYVADTESKKLIDTSPNIRKQLIAILGTKIFTDGKLNRSLMASLIFNDIHLLERVNSIIHPQVELDFRQWLQRQTIRYAVIESAILFESDFNKLVNVTLMVYAPKNLRIQRVMLRDHISRNEILQRMSNQIPDEIKKQRSDYVIINDDKKALIPQIEDFLIKLQNIKKA